MYRLTEKLVPSDTQVSHGDRAAPSDDRATPVRQIGPHRETNEASPRDTHVSDKPRELSELSEHVDLKEAEAENLISSASSTSNEDVPTPHSELARKMDAFYRKRLGSASPSGQVGATSEVNKNATEGPSPSPSGAEKPKPCECKDAEGKPRPQPDMDGRCNKCGRMVEPVLAKAA